MCFVSWTCVGFILLVFDSNVCVCVLFFWQVCGLLDCLLTACEVASEIYCLNVWFEDLVASLFFFLNRVCWCDEFLNPICVLIVRNHEFMFTGGVVGNYLSPYWLSQQGGLMHVRRYPQVFVTLFQNCGFADPLVPAVESQNSCMFRTTANST